MSDLQPESDELARILSRVNALMGQSVNESTAAESAAAEAPPLEDDIPLLTDVYEGELPILSARPNAQALTPQPDHTEQALRGPHTGSVQETHQQAIKVPYEILQALLQEMTPLIQEAVQAGVAQHLAEAAPALSAKLESELVESLRQRLQAFEA